MIFATCMLNVEVSFSNDCSVPRTRRGTCWKRSTDCLCTRTIRPSVSRKCRRRLLLDSFLALWTSLQTTTLWMPARQTGLCSGQVCQYKTINSQGSIEIPRTNTDNNNRIFKRASFDLVYLGYVVLQVLWSVSRYLCSTFRQFLIKIHIHCTCERSAIEYMQMTGEISKIISFTHHFSLGKFHKREN